MTELESPRETEAPGPGAIILYAREQLGISSEDLAAELKITKHKLHLIESNQFEQAGTETFVRGYLRNAARVLQLDIDILLAEYDAFCEVENPHKDNQAPAETLRAEAKPKSKLVLIIPAILLLVCGSWYVYQKVGGESEQVKSVKAQTTKAPLVEPRLLDNVEPIESSANSGQVNGVVAQEPKGAESEKLSGIGEVPTKELVNNSTELANEPPLVKTAETSIQAQENTNNSTELTSQAGTLETPLEGAAEPSLSPGEKSLVFTFSDSCWLQVRDATGKRLYSNTKQAGQELRLQGQPPFRMNFGNVRAVSLTIDGEAVPLQARAGRKTLAITIP